MCSHYIKLITEFQRGDQLKLLLEGCDNNMRDVIGKYCKGNNLFYKYVYVETDTLLSIVWRCDGCCHWNVDPEYVEIFDLNRLVECICLHCEDTDIIDLDSEFIEGYLNIQYEWKADGRVLIMKRDNIPSYKNDLNPGECYRC